MQDLRNYERQLDLIHPSKLQVPITVIGAGGIGSSTVLGLTKMGCGNLTVWDFDLLEAHNVANQMLPISVDRFATEDETFFLGQPKTQALGHLVDIMNQDVSIEYCTRAWQPGDELGAIVIAAVDNMKVRKELFEACLANPEVRWFIDGRMSAEEARIYAVDLMDQTDIDNWLASWVPDSDIPDAPCTAKATIYNSMHIGAWITVVVKTIASGGEPPRAIVHSAVNFMAMNIPR